MNRPFPAHPRLNHRCHGNLFLALWRYMLSQARQISLARLELAGFIGKC
jgi:hypothetical protein